MLGLLNLLANINNHSTYGFAGVFFFVTLEAIGIPLPGEIALVSACLYLSNSHDFKSLIINIVLAILGVLLGSTVGYMIGRYGGFRLISAYGKYVRITPSRLKIVHYLFDKYGFRIIIIGRFLAVLRAYMALIAGTLRMTKKPFFSAVLIGSTLWACFYGFGAYFFYSYLKTFNKTLTYYVLPAAIVLLIIGIFIAKKHEANLAKKADQAFPGDLKNYLN